MTFWNSLIRHGLSGPIFRRFRASRALRRHMSAKSPSPGHGAASMLDGPPVGAVHFCGPAGAEPQIVESPVVQSINPSVDRQRLATGPSVLDHVGLAHMTR